MNDFCKVVDHAQLPRPHDRDMGLWIGVAADWQGRMAVEK